MHLIGRRGFVRGLGLGVGAGLLGPLVGRLIRQARAAEPAQRRLVIWTNENGLIEDHTPVKTGETFDLRGFKRLHTFRDEIVFAQYFNHPYTPDLHGNWYHLTAVGIPEPWTPGGPSIDRFIAQQIGSTHPYSSLNLHITNAAKDATKNGGWGAGGSADGARKPFPGLLTPQQIYDELFKTLVVGDKPAAPVRTQAHKDLDLLSFLGEDIRRLETRLAAPERQKLDQYLTSLREIETRLGAKIEGPGEMAEGCKVPPVDAYAAEAAAGHNDVRFDRDAIDMAALALACNLSRVAALYVATSSHTWWHVGGPFAEWYDANARHLEHLWTRLKEFGVADEAMIVWNTRNGRSHHNGSDRIQFMTLGTWGGAFKGNRFVEFAQGKRGEEGTGRYVGDFWLEVAQKMGVKADKFGTSTTPTSLFS